MPESVSVRVETNLPATMRDGVVLYADVYRPDGPGPFPVILQRTPYDKESPLSGQMLDPMKAAKNGFALIIQDTRGRFTSEGEFYCFSDDVNDGYDTVEWAATLPWSNGKVGMVGASYVGATQWLAATTRPPHLVTLVPNVTASNYHNGWTYQGGAFELGFNVSWTLNQLTLANYPAQSRGKNVPQERQGDLLNAVDGMTEAFLSLPLNDLPYLKDGLATYYFDWLAHPDFDDYWKALCIEDQHSNITTPALHIGGWYDIFLGGTIRNFQGMRKSGATDEAPPRPEADHRPLAAQFKGHQHGRRPLFRRSRRRHGTGTRRHSPALVRPLAQWGGQRNSGRTAVKIFVMGDNVWRDEQEWPLARARNTEYYLHSGGKANSRHGDGTLSAEGPGEEASDVFLYNPADPVPTVGGALCCNPYFASSGAFDQNDIEARADVLVYSTPPLEREVEVTGPITVTLWAATSAADTDFTAKLVDVCEDGCARNLTDGIIRARYRESMSSPTLVEPGRAYCYTIDLWATSNVFQRGHQIRLEISSSNFPRFDRNTNTGNLIAGDAELKPALQTVLHNAQHPSHVTLPIIPR